MILVAEGAGQHLLQGGDEQRDASGNVKAKDIGACLCEKIGVLAATGQKFALSATPACTPVRARFSRHARGNGRVHAAATAGYARIAW